jgi:hypothetical protein
VGTCNNQIGSVSRIIDKLPADDCAAENSKIKAYRFTDYAFIVIIIIITITVIIIIV